jgi:hypothetical protein
MPTDNPATSTETLTLQEVIRQRAAACQSIVDDAVDQALEVEEFLDRLRLAGATSAEAEDYAQQYTQRMESRPNNFAQPPLGAELNVRDATPEGLDDEQRETFRQE